MFCHMFLPLILLINSYDIVPSMIFSLIDLVRFLFYHQTKPNAAKGAALNIHSQLVISIPN